LQKIPSDYFHSIISRCSSKNGRIPISRNKAFALIKWQKAGLEELLGSPCIKGRIGGMAKKDYRRDEHKNSPSSFNIAQLNDFIRKES